MNTRFKYPRTPHLPWSPGVSADDLRCINTGNFLGKSVVVTEKMDGENTTLYSDYCHARSIDGRHHPSRDWVKSFHAKICADIPQGWRVCGENLYAQHALNYDSLESYFYGFSIWDHQNRCLSWSDTLTWFDSLEIVVPKILFEGEWNEKSIKALTIDTNRTEGYVVRIAEDFHFDDFSKSVAKWVRHGHVQTEEHWMLAAIKPNKLKGAI